MKIKYLLPILIFTCLFNSLYSQTSKFSKWLLPSYFQGFNISFENYINGNPRTQADFTALKQSGANIAQLATRGFNRIKPPYQTDPVVIAQLDSMVSYCRTSQLYYVIAVRTGPGRQDVDVELKYPVDSVSTIWTNSSEQQLYASMVKNMAQRYSSDSLFAGLNLSVEPVPFPNQYYYPSQLDSALNANSISMKNIYKIFIDSVRAIDANLPLIVETVNASDPEFFGILQRQTDNKIVYDFHAYNPYQYSHDTIVNNSAYPGNYPSISNNGNNTLYNKIFIDSIVLAPVKNFQALNNVPIFMGEFGLKLKQNGGTQYLKDYADLAKSHCWHFALWSFKTLAQFDYELMGAAYWNTVTAMFNPSIPPCLTGTEEMLTDPSIHIYPNPFSTAATVTISSANAAQQNLNIQLFNLLGEEVYRSAIRDQKTEILAEHLAGGLYFYKISNGTNILSTGKIIIDR